MNSTTVNRKNPDEPIGIPFTIAIDHREKLPYQFRTLRADAKQRRRPLAVSTQIVALPSGDYSILGYEDKIAVERKSLVDLFGTLGGGRDRFLRELDRLSSMRYAAVVVESDWRTVVDRQPAMSGMSAEAITGSVIAWQQMYPGVHWWMVNDRDLGERMTFKILARWWKRNCERGQEQEQEKERQG